MKKWVYYLLILPICFEIALLILGFRKYERIDYSIVSTPSYCLSPDIKFGFALTPGNFRVTINKGHTYSVTHTEDSLRRIPFPCSDSVNQKVYFFGCSYTYGMGVNDDETFSAIIQKELPTIEIKNFGVPGFGTVQSYLQLQKMIAENDIPTKVILNYADFHDMRNALSPFYRENLKIGFERSNKDVKHIMDRSRIPFVDRKNDAFEIAFCKWDKLYNHWPLRENLASVNFLQSKIDLKKDKTMGKKDITFFLVEQMQQLCEENHIQFLVAGITATKATQLTLEEFEKRGIETMDISVDLKLKKYNNMPFDSHPNKLTHAIWAERILDKIEG